MRAGRGRREGAGHTRSDGVVGAEPQGWLAVGIVVGGGGAPGGSCRGSETDTTVMRL